MGAAAEVAAAPYRARAATPAAATAEVKAHAEAEAEAVQVQPRRKRSAAAAAPAPPPAGGLRMEVACCDADHEGEWEGEWEECEVVADHGETCDVRIVEDGELCYGVPRRLVRAAAAAAAEVEAEVAAGWRRWGRRRSGCFGSLWWGS